MGCASSCSGLLNCRTNHENGLQLQNPRVESNPWAVDHFVELDVDSMAKMEWPSVLQSGRASGQVWSDRQDQSKSCSRE